MYYLEKKALKYKHNYLSSDQNKWKTLYKTI